MTDTLADSRTSSRTFTEGVPLVVEDVTGRPEVEPGEAEVGGSVRGHGVQRAAWRGWPAPAGGRDEA